MTAQNGGDTLAKAMQLVALGRHDDSEALFNQLIESNSHVAESMYGLGVIRLNTGKIDLAQQQFERCVSIQPNHANAYYYLGHIAELKKDDISAATFFKKALAVNPKHAGALRRTSKPAPDGAVPEPSSSQAVGVTGNDLFGLLRRSTEPVEQEMASRLDAIAGAVNATRGRRLTAFLGTATFLATLALAVPALVMLLAIQMNTNIPDAAAIMLLGLSMLFSAAFVAFVLRLRYSRISVDRDWLLLKTGVLSRRTTNLHLFILSREPVSIEQTFVDRLTNNGTLRFDSISFRGFFRGSELDALSQHFRQLSLLNPTSRQVLAAIGELKQIRSGTQ